MALWYFHWCYFAVIIMILRYFFIGEVCNVGRTGRTLYDKTCDILAKR